MIRKTITATLLSILVFFSISFLTVLQYVNAPWNRIIGGYEMKIGFPLTYYHEFMVDCPIPNSGWDGVNLLIDCGLTWIVVVVFWHLKNQGSSAYFKSLMQFSDRK